MHLRTPWDKPTTEPVVDLESTMSTPNHPEIPVTEITILSHATNKPAFKLSFINLVNQEIVPSDSEEECMVHRALRRRGLYENHTALFASTKLVPSYSTPRRLVHVTR